MSQETEQGSSAGADIEFSRFGLEATFALSPELQLQSRKIMAVFLQGFAATPASEIALALGLSEATICRIKNNGPMLQMAYVMAVMGLKAVPVDALVFIQPDAYK
jgi:hypothetical protein